jgi:hypothetical protein
VLRATVTRGRGRDVALQFATATVGGLPQADWLLVDRGASGFAVVRGAVLAFWPTLNGRPPSPGPVPLYGHLWGTAHGGSIPDDLPAVAGVVQRVWVVSEVDVLRDVGRAEMIMSLPGTAVLTEVSDGPRHFRFVVPPRGGSETNEVGVLMELPAAAA